MIAAPQTFSTLLKQQNLPPPAQEFARNPIAHKRALWMD